MSQNNQIRQALLDGEKLTPLDALKRFGCFRLGARIWDLKKEGLNIEMNIITAKNKKRYAEYRLIK